MNSFRAVNSIVRTVVLFGCLVVLGFVLPSSSLAAQCVSGNIPSSNVSVSVTSQSGSNSSVSAWSWFKVQVDLNDLDGMASGCKAVVALPSMFGGMQSQVLYLNADGSSSASSQTNSVATMTIDAAAKTVTFVLTDYASSHVNVSASGWLTVQLNSSIVRGETTPVNVVVNGQVVHVTDVIGKTCTTDCPTMPFGHAGKWGNVNQDKTGSVTIQTPVVETSGTTITVKDTLVSSGQTINSVMNVRGFTCVNTWGDPGVLQADNSCKTNVSLPAVCGAGSANDTCVVTSSTPNEFFRVMFNMTFTGNGPWQDKGVITFPGKTYQTTANVYAYSAGGGANGADQQKKAALTIEKVATKTTYQPGEEATFVLQVTNNGPATATNTQVCDVYDSNWSFVSANGLQATTNETLSAPIAVQLIASGDKNLSVTTTSGKTCFNVGNLAKDAKQAITIKLKLSNTANGSVYNKATAKADNSEETETSVCVCVRICSPAENWENSNTGGDPAGQNVTVNKTQKFVGIQAQQETTQTISCNQDETLTDGSYIIQHVDQGTGTLEDVTVTDSYSTSKNTWSYRIKNNTTGQAQLQLFATCMKAEQSINTTDLIEKTVSPTAQTTTTQTVTLECSPGWTPIAIGYQNNPTILESEPVSINTWQLKLQPADNLQTKITYRCLSHQTGTSAQTQTQNLVFSHKIVNLTIPANTPSQSYQVTCDDLAKGITPSYTLPPGVTTQGNEPQPKTRVFWLTNQTDQPQQVTIDLVCVGVRTTAKATCDCNKQPEKPAIPNTTAEPAQEEKTETPTPSTPSPAPATPATPKPATPSKTPSKEKPAKGNSSKPEKGSSKGKPTKGSSKGKPAKGNSSSSTKKPSKNKNKDNKKKNNSKKK